jgi:hypothetical protein
MSATDRTSRGGDAEDERPVRGQFAGSRVVSDALAGPEEDVGAPPRESGYEVPPRPGAARQRSPSQPRSAAPSRSQSESRPRPRRTPPPRRRAGVTRRQWMRRAVASSLGLSVAGFIGYELHPASGDAAAERALQREVAHPTPTTTGVTSLEVQSFVTRPDLKPPTVKMTHFSTSDTSPPYILLSVNNVIPTDQIQQGLMMIDRQGRLVWFHPVSPKYKPFDLNAFTVRGQPVLGWWSGELDSSHGEGSCILVDSSYAPVERIHAGHGLQADLHELYITSRGTALITAYQQTSADLSTIGGPSKAPVFTGHVQEIELSGGKVLFDWSSLDHVGVEETYMGRPRAGEVFDYFHLNSVAETTDGNLLVSARNTSAVYKVDRKSGQIIWRLGGRKSDFNFTTSEAQFHWQHDARAWSDTTFSVFDNGANGSETRSRGLMLNLNESAKTASLIQAYEHPAGFVSPALGSVTRLPGGRVFVGWGDQPYFSEFAADGTMLLDGQLPIGVRSYRAFAVYWTGKPSGQPAVSAKQNPAGGFVVRASWNGATEISRWQILGGPSPSQLAPVGEQEWTNFETAVAVNSAGPSFQAVALDSSGNELGRSTVV